MKAQSNNVYRTEHPNPMFQRDNYQCLNGIWEFDFGKGQDKTTMPLSMQINVPFCPESQLSGIGRKDLFVDCVYAKEIDVTEEDLQGRLVLHFGAVDYHAQIFVNGAFAGEHKGGYTAFEVDITAYCHVGKNRITVCVHDDVWENVPSGKQTNREMSFGCFYTRITGIWQTVWLERTPKAYVKSVKFFPDVQNCSVKVEVITEGKGDTNVEVFFGGKLMGKAFGDGYYRQEWEIPLAEKHLWELGVGNLYDVTVTFGEDVVHSYFGLRQVGYVGKKFMLNGNSVFQRLVLDQGYYPDGLYTAPTKEHFVKDIQLALDLGFNGARLHQKVFEQRFLYECDKLGYMVWSEHGNWGMHCEDIDAIGNFLAEWREVVEQQFNHPSIITWCPLNELWFNLEDPGKLRDIRLPEMTYAFTKLLDPTRPCVDVSGGLHGRYTDVADFHAYDLYDGLKARMDKANKGEMDFVWMYREPYVGYNGEPINLSEFGGVSFGGQRRPADDSLATVGWGYETCDEEDVFVDNYVKMIKLLLGYENLSGFCYTQLYDIEQEQNGFYFYDRKPKLGKQSIDKIAQCNKMQAKIEK